MFSTNFKFLSRWFITSRLSLIAQRCKTTKSEIHPNTAKLKLRNTDNKLLYGPVLKKSKKNVIEQPPADVEQHDQSTDKTSEIFWLMEHKPDLKILEKPIKSKKTAKKKKSIDIVQPKKLVKEKALKPPKVTSYGLPKSPQISKKATLPDTLEKFTEALVPVPVKVAKIGKTSTEKHENIPFTAKELKAMLTFPLFEQQSDELCVLKVRQISPEFRVPSVSSILSATMPESSRKALEKWKIMKIAELGLEGFENLQREHFAVGRNFHVCLQKYFETGAVELETIDSELWRSVGTTLDKFQTPANLVETYLTHQTLQYKGVVDCITVIDNTLNIIEWKKSDRLKAIIDHTYDAPIQLAAYLGALLSDEKHRHLNIRNGVVVVGYTNGIPANVHSLNESDLNKYWHMWLKRLQEYWIRVRDNTLPENL